MGVGDLIQRPIAAHLPLIQTWNPPGRRTFLEAGDPSDLKFLDKPLSDVATSPSVFLNSQCFYPAGETQSDPTAAGCEVSGLGVLQPLRVPSRMVSVQSNQDFSPPLTLSPSVERLEAWAFQKKRKEKKRIRNPAGMCPRSLACHVEKYGFHTTTSKGH